MLLQIDGWRGAGKGALWTLLDGHNDIFCSPVHDHAFEAFTEGRRDPEWLVKKDIRTVRRLLYNTGYYKFEVFSHAKVYYLDFGAGDRLKIPFNLDFYEFDKLFFSSLVNADNWSRELIINELYKNLEKFYSPKSYTSKYHVAMGGIKDWRNNKFHNAFPRAKCIQVRRDIEGILATISNRVSHPLDKSSTSSYAKSFDKRIKENEIEKILTYYSAYDKLMEKHPETYYKIDFKYLVEDTEEAMNKIAEFLDVKYSKILSIATRDGEELICNGKKYVGKVNDDPAELLSKKELRTIINRKRFYSLHKQNYNPLSKSAFKYIFKKLV